MPTVHHNHAASRFDIYDDGFMAGSLQYRSRGSEIWFLETRVSPGFRGRDLSGILIGRVLRQIRRRRIAVLPFCPRVGAFICAHGEYLDLVPPAQRRRFKLGQRPGAQP